MHVAVTEFSRTLLHQQDISAASVEELQQLVARYPFFVPGRLLYLKKLQADNSPLLGSELGKAEIWVPNTAWLDHLVFDTGTLAVANSAGHAKTGTGEALITTAAPPVDNEIINTDEDETATDNATIQESDVAYDQLTGLSTSVTEEVEAPVDDREEVREETPPAPGPEQTDGAQIGFDESETDGQSSFVEAASSVEAAGNPSSFVETSSNVEAAPTNEKATSDEESYSAFDEMNRYETAGTGDADAGSQQELPAPSNSEDALTPVPEVEEESADEPEIIVEDDTAGDDHDVHEADAAQSDIPHRADDTDTENFHPGTRKDATGLDTEDGKALEQGHRKVSDEVTAEGFDDEDEGMFADEEEPSGGVEFRIAPFREEPLTENAEISFEPLHTVDYFASQGIQAKEEERPADRFSQQLKSFTQWLKAMKKIPATTPGEGIREEKQIEEMAEHSIQGKDVWTEAMAEVWIKQGNVQKARLVYEKLSLLDPSKSTYFAAKIEQLKH